MNKKLDYLIIGGGIVGLAVGIQLLKKQPKLKVVIAEKESDLGEHASGRNSGVLHAGFYYSPDSLKAQFCRDGNIQLREIISRHSIPIRKTGKVVVTANTKEIERLEQLYNKGISNGVKVELLPESELVNYEPLARTTKKFLWSPTTAVSDPNLVIRAMAQDFESLGGTIFLKAEVYVISEDKIFINGEKVDASLIVNSAGANAIHLAQALGVGMEYNLLPVLGKYRTIPGEKLPLKSLVYPVPNPLNPFLGVHFTLTHDGIVKIGPTAIPVMGREQYKLSDGFDSSDFHQSLGALTSLASKSVVDLLKLGAAEFPKISTKFMVKSGAKLVPSVSGIHRWDYKKPGLRAQLVNKKTGRFEQDFVVTRKGKFVHILNAVSPGWTASIPFASWITNKFLMD